MSEAESVSAESTVAPEGVADAIAESDAGAPPGETPAEAERRRYRVTVDGAEREVDEDELVKNYELRGASHQRMREAAKKRQEAEAFAEALADPDKFWKAASALHGPKLDAMIEARLAERLEREAMPEDERRLRDRETQLAERERRIAEAEAVRQREEAERATSAERTRYEAEIGAAAAAAGVPKTPRSIARIAEVMLDAHRDGYQMPAEEAARVVRDEYRAEVGGYLGGLEGDRLLEELGPVADRFRSADVTRFKRAEAAKAKPVAAPSPKRQPGKRPISTEEFWEMRRREREGR